MTKLKALFMVTAAISVAYAQTSKPTKAPSELTVGSAAPPIKVSKWIKGKPNKLGHGNINVVEFWATWCVPCKVSIPHLTELAKKYKGKANFTGVSVYERPDTDMAAVEKFVKDEGESMSYNVAADAKGGVMAKSWMEAAKQEGIPTAFVIGKDGKILWIGHPMGGLDEVLDQVVEGTFDPKAEAAKQTRQQKEMAARQKAFQPMIQAMQAKKWKEAVAEMDKLEAADFELKEQLKFARFTATVNFDDDAAQKLAAELGEQYKDNAEALNSVVWPLVEDKSPIKKLDTDLVIRLAKRAVEVSKESDANIMDTLAVTYFRADKLDDAIATEKKAITLAEATKDYPPATLKELKDRLAEYTKKKG